MRLPHKPFIEETEMKYLLFENLAVMACAVLGFLFGARYLKIRKGLYARMIVDGVLCIAVGRLFQCALLLMVIPRMNALVRRILSRRKTRQV